MRLPTDELLKIHLPLLIFHIVCASSRWVGNMFAGNEEMFEKSGDEKKSTGGKRSHSTKTNLRGTFCLCVKWKTFRDFIIAFSWLKVSQILILSTSFNLSKKFN